MALLDVDPGGLYGAADELAAAAALVAHRGPARRAELVAPAEPGGPQPGAPQPGVPQSGVPQSGAPQSGGQASPGWATLLALAGAADTWIGYLGGLHDALEASAGAVRASADAYVAADRAADSAQRRAARGITW